MLSLKIFEQLKINRETTKMRVGGKKQQRFEEMKI